MTIDPNADARPALERREVSSARSGARRTATCFPAELDDGDIFLVAATDTARTISGEARASFPKKGRPSDDTEWILPGRLGATIQRLT